MEKLNTTELKNNLYLLKKDAQKHLKPNRKDWMIYEEINSFIDSGIKHYDIMEEAEKTKYVKK